MLHLRFLLNVLLSVLAAVWLYSHAVRALRETYRKGHDASTVARMLARIGEGTAHYEDSEQYEVYKNTSNHLTGFSLYWS